MSILELLDLVLKHHAENVPLNRFLFALAVALAVSYGAIYHARLAGISYWQSLATITAIALAVIYLVKWPW